MCCDLFNPVCACNFELYGQDLRIDSNLVSTTSINGNDGMMAVVKKIADSAAEQQPAASASSTAYDSSVSKGELSVQFRELLKKRYIMGLFFQMLFPALQILAVLAILTVKVNPAGHTVKMNPTMFRQPPVMYVGGNSSNSLAQHFSTTSMNPITVPYCRNSSDMSNRLLSDPAFALPHQMGAVVFEDAFLANLTLNWDWVGSNLQVFLESPLVKQQVLQFINGRSISLPTLLGPVSTNLTTNLILSLPALPPQQRLRIMDAILNLFARNNISAAATPQIL